MQDKQNRASRALTLTGLEDKNIEEAMELLFTHQKQCQKTGKYMEADQAKKQLARMKVELERQRKEQLLLSFQTEQQEVEAAHQEQMADFDSYWDGKFIEYQTEAEKIENTTLERHAQEQQEFAEVVHDSIPLTKKQTGELITLRRVEQQLARAESYTEAHQIQRQIQQVERKQNQKWSVMREHKIRNLFTQLQNKQEIELSALRQKITQGFDQQKRVRQVEEQKLVQKFQNFMKELGNRHNQEIIRLEKSFKIQSTMSFSRSQTTSRVLQNRNN